MAERRVAIIAPEDLNVTGFAGWLKTVVGDKFSVLPIIGAITQFEASEKAFRLPELGVSIVILPKTYPRDPDLSPDGGAEVEKKIREVYQKTHLPIAVLVLDELLNQTPGQIRTTLNQAVAKQFGR